MVCWGCFWSGCPPSLSCCKPGLPIFGRCSMMPGNPGVRLKMRLTLTIWPEMNSTSRKWWWWSPLQERWGSQGRNLDCSKESQLWILTPIFSQAFGRMFWFEEGVRLFCHVAKKDAVLECKRCGVLNFGFTVSLCSAFWYWKQFWHHPVEAVSQECETRLLL